MTEHAPSTAHHEVDIAIVGGGSGNTIFDEAFADRTAVLIDPGVGPRRSFGGTCLNVGCIPTKMYVIPADLAKSPQLARRLGIAMQVDKPVDVAAIRDRIFRRIDPIADAGAEYRAGMSNLSLLRERARFLDPHTLQVGETTVRADQIVLAAGSRARWPHVPGFDDPALVGTSVVDSDQLVRMPAQPRRIVIVGGGVEAAEFSHILTAFGSDVTMVARGERLLSAVDRDVSDAFTILQREKVQLQLGETPHAVRAAREDEDGQVVLTTLDRSGAQHEYLTDMVLVAIGRIPNSDLLDLDVAGVEVDEGGRVRVDRHQRTTAEHIWALGDITSPQQLKHVANMQARIVRHNLLHPAQLRSCADIPIPSGIFGDPQVATIGATEKELEEQGIPFICFTQKFGDVAQGWAHEDEHHFVKVLGEPGTARLLGAHILGPDASSLIQPLIQLMSFEQDTEEMVREQYWIHPAMVEVVENALLGLVHAVKEEDPSQVVEDPPHKPAPETE